MHILAEVNTFSRSWKLMSQLNTFNTTWQGLSLLENVGADKLWVMCRLLCLSHFVCISKAPLCSLNHSETFFVKLVEWRHIMEIIHFGLLDHGLSAQLATPMVLWQLLASYWATTWQWLLSISFFTKCTKLLVSALEEFFVKVDETNTTFQLFLKTKQYTMKTMAKENNINNILQTFQ